MCQHCSSREATHWLIISRKERVSGEFRHIAQGDIALCDSCLRQPLNLSHLMQGTAEQHGYATRT